MYLYALYRDKKSTIAVRCTCKECGSLPMEDRLPMTEQEILQQMDELQIKLDEIRAGRAAFSVNSSLTEAEKEKQHQEDLQRLRGLRLIDDDFMNACFDGYTDGAQLLLRIILNKPDIRVKSVKTQRRMKNLLGRDICLDIDADDETGKEYNVEVQRQIKEPTGREQGIIPVSLTHICFSQVMISAICRIPM